MEASKVRRLELRVTPELAGVKVDTLLKKHMGLSGTVVRRIKWLEDGILADGRRVTTRYCPQDGEVLSVAYAARAADGLLRVTAQAECREEIGREVPAPESDRPAETGGPPE